MTEILLAISVGVAAALYASVGHGGASAYIAILALAGMARPEIAPTVLLMNIVVSALAWRRFAAGGYFDRRLAFTLIVFSAPAAFVGGLLRIAPTLFSILLGVAVLGAGIRLLLPDPPIAGPRPVAAPRRWATAGVVGTTLGLLAGLTGVGGGIYLSPLLLLMRWKDVRGTAAVSAAFIFVNSITGLSGRLIRGEVIDTGLLPLVAAAIIGGLIGSRWGAGTASARLLRAVLGAVLLVAGAKLLFGV